MTHLQIAQKIADCVDLYTQGEVNAMMAIICDTTDIEMSWLFPAVSNLYAEANPSVLGQVAK